MNDYGITKRVEAMHHTQKALDVLNALVMKTPETSDMIHHLEDVRKELAYEIFRCKS